MKQTITQKAEKKFAGRKCSICEHQDADLINSMIGEGKSFRSISECFGVNIASISRHKSNHLNLETQAIIEEKKIENVIRPEEVSIPPEAIKNQIEHRPETPRNIMNLLRKRLRSVLR